VSYYRLDDEPETYRFKIIPNPQRSPKLKRHWLRLMLVCALLAGAVFSPVWGTWVVKRIGCRPGLLPSADVWRQDGECVGLSEGPYAFGNDRFAKVMNIIHKQNGDAPCSNAKPAVVGVLTTMTSAGVGGRALHELEGFAYAQQVANSSVHCSRHIRLRVAQIGAGEQAAVATARALAGDENVVAVVGAGLSDPLSAAAIEALTSVDQPVPVVADLITAEGFDAAVPGVSRPELYGCEGTQGYANGIGHGYFRRVSFRNGAQVTKLSEYFRGPLDFIVKPTTLRDPYTCTTLPLVVEKYPQANQVPFSPDDPATLGQTVSRICLRTHSSDNLHVFYTARARDLGRFLAELASKFDNRECAAESVTVLSTSDAARMRAEETEVRLEETRTKALGSAAFRSGQLRLVYTPLADPNLLPNTTFQDAFEAAGYPRSDLDDGWAINAYNALQVVSRAINSLKRDEVTRVQVNNAIATATDLPAVGPKINFDRAGNRAELPDVVRLCPARADRPHTILANGNGFGCT
jgi:hypothetical protein